MNPLAHLQTARTVVGHLDEVDAEIVAKGLGVFSLALGAGELLAPGLLGRLLGLPGRPMLFRAYGLREIGAGLGILTQRRMAPWVWARVAGDALDLATLAFARPRSRAEVAGLTTAATAVIGVLALDLFCAVRLTHEDR